MVLPHQTNPSTSTDAASPTTSMPCNPVPDAKPEDCACSAVEIVPAKRAVIELPPRVPGGRLKSVLNPERPWRDIPLAEFPAGMESWSGLAQPDWICGPCVCSDVSSDVEARNFHVLWDRLATLHAQPDRGQDNDWDLITATHWTAGTVEFIFVRPGSPAHALCDDIRRELACFPDLAKHPARVDSEG